MKFSKSFSSMYLKNNSFQNVVTEILKVKTGVLPKLMKDVTGRYVIILQP